MHVVQCTSKSFQNRSILFCEVVIKEEEVVVLWLAHTIGCFGNAWSEVNTRVASRIEITLEALQRIECGQPASCIILGTIYH